MVRTTLIFAAMVVAAPAWAVGERIVLPAAASPFADQIKETLCVSMECLSAGEAKAQGLDATVTGKVIKGKKGAVEVELQVLSASGAVKATVKAPANETGRMSSMDLVTATSALIKAIEGPEPVKAPKADAKQQLAAKAKKHSPLRLAAKVRTSRDRG